MIEMLITVRREGDIIRGRLMPMQNKRFTFFSALVEDPFPHQYTTVYVAGRHKMSLGMDTDTRQRVTRSVTMPTISCQVVMNDQLLTVYTDHMSTVRTKRHTIRSVAHIADHLGSVLLQIVFHQFVMFSF